MKKIFKGIAFKIGENIFMNNESKIIFYHDIHKNKKYTEMSTSINLFKKHIDELINQGYELVSTITNDIGQIKIQMDDGFRGIYDCYDFLIKNNIPLEVFLITDKIGSNNYLSKSQILDLFDDNLITFSSHTSSHLNLTLCNEEKIHQELLNSKFVIEDLLHENISSLCFPMGYFSQKIVQIAKNIGFSKMYSSIPGSYRDTIISSNVYRRNLVQFSSVFEFKSILNGGNRIIENRLMKKYFIK